MYRIPLHWDESYLLLVPRFGGVALGWQWLALALCFLVPLILIVWLYRYELRLVTRGTAAFLLLLRVIVLFFLWFVIGLQPTVARDHEEELPSRVLIAVDASASMDTRDPQRSGEERQALADALGYPEKDAGRVDTLSRAEIARLVLQERGWLAKLAGKHQIEVVGFDRALWEMTPASPAQPNVGRQTTDLALPLAHALAPGRADRGKWLGIVVFSDGKHNAGGSLLAKAKELGERKVPVYPVVIGAKQPPADIAVVEVQAPGSVFKDADIPVEARLRLSGVAAQNIVVELFQDGVPFKPEQKKTIAHDGKDRTMPIRFQVKGEELGTRVLQVKARGESKELREVTLDNNTQATVVRVGQDKARVLLIDGEARWEHHYLATALQRDPAVQPDLVLFSQPRVGNIAEEKLEKLGHARGVLPELKAKEEDPLSLYDCIFLGDVPPAKLSPEERRRLESYVAQRGGTLVFMAGKRHLPLEYLDEADAGDDPLLKMLPLLAPKAISPIEGFGVALTSAGNLTPFLQLEEEQTANNKRWQEFPKHYWGLAGKPKPGATALVVSSFDKTDAESKDTLDNSQALIVQQSYGFGRVLLVGTDSTWRWRYKIGDTYHHRFWGQIVRWSAADKLLPGGNRYVRFGAREPVVRPGKSADVVVRLAEELAPLKDGAEARVKLWRKTSDEAPEEAAATANLTATKAQARLLETQVRDLAPGQYRIEVDIPSLRDKVSQPADESERKLAHRDTFTVLPPEEGELYDLATDWALAQSLADESGGRVFTPETVDELLSLFARQIVRKQEREEQKVWQDEPFVWWVFGLLTGLLTIEWIVRKWSGLP